MTDSLPEPPELDPAALAASEFARVRRGLEPTEVRAALGRAADALRTWSERDARLRQRLSELEQRLDESHELDEQRIATVLGEETARIVTAARDAAAEIRSKAEEQAARLIAESEQQATAAAEALKGEAQTLRDEAARVAAEAAAEAEALRSASRDEAERLRAEADEAAATTREEAAALATSTVSDAQVRADELLGAAELVMSERTAEAEAAAAVLTEAAAEQVAAAEAAATALREEADAYATSVREEAELAAETIRAEAEAAAVAVVEEATERGRSMVAEARAVRERMLSDLAEKRRTARRQLEGALAGRDRIIEVLRAAGDEVAGTISGLEGADDDVAAAAEAAAAASEIDLDAELAELREQLTEDLEDADSTGLEQVAAVEVLVAEVSTEVVVEQGGEAPAPAAVEPAGADDAASGAAHERETDEPDEAESLVLVDLVPDAAGEPSAAQDAAEELAAEPEEHTEPTGSEGGATVHDLFARIRAEGIDDDGSDQDDAGTGASTAPAAIDLTVTGDDQGGATAAEPVAGAVAVAEAQVGDRLFDRRDEVLLPVEKGLARGLKRLASDEQNEILDRLRRVKRGRPDPAEILPAADPAPFVDALAAEFARAVDAGAQFWAELAGTSPVAVDEHDAEVRAELDRRVQEFLALHRAHLEKTFAEADEAAADTAELGDRVRASYRDWRSGSLADLAGDLATAGFTLGERRAAGEGTPWCWKVDHGGLPCADGEDNALAGEVACGEPFPTGDVTPPAHPGCRCILTPASR
jgi:cell division septum initiation protein DivIVA